MNRIEAGRVLESPDEEVPNLFLFDEVCSEEQCKYTKKDRYGLCCNIYDGNTHVFRTRHEDYPWKALPVGERNYDEKWRHTTSTTEDRDVLPTLRWN